MPTSQDINNFLKHSLCSSAGNGATTPIGSIAGVGGGGGGGGGAGGNGGGGGGGNVSDTDAMSLLGEGGAGPEISAMATLTSPRRRRSASTSR